MSRNAMTAPAMSPRPLRIGAVESAMTASFLATAPKHRSVWRQTNGLSLFEYQFDGIAYRFSRFLIEKRHDVADWTATRLFPSPACHLFSSLVQVIDGAMQVGTDDGIADGIERDRRAFLFGWRKASQQLIRYGPVALNRPCAFKPVPAAPRASSRSGSGSARSLLSSLLSDWPTRRSVWAKSPCFCASRWPS